MLGVLKTWTCSVGIDLAWCYSTLKNSKLDGIEIGAYIDIACSRWAQIKRVQAKEENHDERLKLVRLLPSTAIAPLTGCILKLSCHSIVRFTTFRTILRHNKNTFNYVPVNLVFETFPYSFKRVRNMPYLKIIHLITQFGSFFLA